MAEKLSGVVSKYNGKFGFISLDGEEIFFHSSSVLNSAKLSPNDEVSFVKEKIPKEDRKKPSQKFRAVEIELVSPAAEAEGKTGAKETASKEKSGPWKITPLGEVSGLFVRAHGNDYNFHLKTDAKTLPPLWVSTSVPMQFFDAESDVMLEQDSTGKLILTKSDFVMKIWMKKALRGDLGFKSPGAQDQKWVLEFS